MGVNVIFNDINYQVLPKQRELFDQYCKIIQWGRRHPTRFAEQFMNIQFTDMQKWLILNSWIPSTVVWCCSRGSGKATALDTKVYFAIRDRETRNGKKLRSPKTIGELQVGDKIYDDSGNLTEVIHLNPIIFDEEYKVYFEDGEVISCNGEHLWKVNEGIDENEQEYAIRETNFIYNEYLKRRKNEKDYYFYVPLSKPIKHLVNSFHEEKMIHSSKSQRKAIIKVEKTGKKIPMRCITVNNESGLFLCGEKMTVTHNSYMGAILVMLKSLLFPSHSSYIMAPSGSQSMETFTKIENIAKNNIASAIGISSVFIDECTRMNAKADPFTHNAQGYAVSLYNGSTINSLNSVAKNIVGKSYAVLRLNQHYRF